MSILGRKVTAVRFLTGDELRREMWDDAFVTAIEFDDGLIIFASRDEEGNAPGEIFGQGPTGKQLIIYPEE